MRRLIVSLVLVLFVVGCVSQPPQEVLKCKIEITQQNAYDGSCVAKVAAQERDSSICQKTFGSHADNCLMEYATLTNDSTVCEKTSSAEASIVCYQGLNMTPPAGTVRGILYDVGSKFIENENKLPPAPTTLSPQANISYFSIGQGTDLNNPSDLQYAVSFSISDNGNAVNPEGTGRVIISDASTQLLEKEFPINSSSYTKLGSSIMYSEWFNVTKSQIKQFTNSTTVQVTFVYTGLGRSFNATAPLKLG